MDRLESTNSAIDWVAGSLELAVGAQQHTAFALLANSIDLRTIYHQVAIYPLNEYKIAFLPNYGLVEYPVLLFNKFSLYILKINEWCVNMIDKYVLVYFDDILVYSESATKYKEHLR